MSAEPTPTTFASAPDSWYYIGSTKELGQAPCRFDLPEGLSFVGFLDENGLPVVIDARCSHMGADLGRGCVIDGRIVCPLHGWTYNRTGACTDIPASRDIPAFARQQTYPVETIGGHVFFFNRPEARFPLPFFDGVDRGSLDPAAPFGFEEKAPWYLVGGNGFDRQHFEMTHDRRLLAEPVVDQPHPFAMRSRLELGIEGDSATDRITRAFAGKRSTMTVTSWCGTMVFATARFRRTTTYGVVLIQPLDNFATRCRVIVWVPKSENPVARRLLDPLHARIRRRFIQAFFRDDIGRLSGTRFERKRMIAADGMLVDYLDWLLAIHR